MPQFAVHADDPGTGQVAESFLVVRQAQRLVPPYRKESGPRLQQDSPAALRLGPLQVGGPAQKLIKLSQPAAARLAPHQVPALDPSAPSARRDSHVVAGESAFLEVKAIEKRHSGPGIDQEWLHRDGSLPPSLIDRQ